VCRGWSLGETWGKNWGCRGGRRGKWEREHDPKRGWDWPWWEMTLEGGKDPCGRRKSPVEVEKWLKVKLQRS
jgi:hypothetical protein